MSWAEGFYSRTGRWWGEAESGIRDRDRDRVALLQGLCGAGSLRVLELGCGYGGTAAALAEAGHRVTGIELTDRADRAAPHVERWGVDRLRIVRGDFYDATVDGRFDVVAYWNGFGIGTDADQRRLLSRIAGEWLVPDGTALVDVCNPFVWAGWDGDVERLGADPGRGYHHDLTQHTTFDPVTCTAIDTWWETTEPDKPITQRLRCYTPADLGLLLAGTGLRLDAIRAGGEPVDPAAAQPGLASLLREVHEYLAVLKPAGDGTS